MCIIIVETYYIETLSFGVNSGKHVEMSATACELLAFLLPPRRHGQARAVPSSTAALSLDTAQGLGYPSSRLQNTTRSSLNMADRLPPYVIPNYSSNLLQQQQQQQQQHQNSQQAQQSGQQQQQLGQQAQQDQQHPSINQSSMDQARMWAQQMQQFRQNAGADVNHNNSAHVSSSIPFIALIVSDLSCSLPWESSCLRSSAPILVIRGVQC